MSAEVPILLIRKRQNQGNHSMLRSILILPAFFGWLVLSSAFPQTAEKKPPRLQVPPGFVVELVAGSPLVEHPMMGGFDERGRLFLAESAGQNLKAAELLKVFPNSVRVLQPADAKGFFREGHVWAPKMSFPMGALWHRGTLFTASPPSLWKLEETQGVSDRRVELVSKFGFTGNAADIHGPFLGPDGRLYWCDGRHGHQIPRGDGTLMQGKAARIFRCKIDGSEVEVVCGGGMDNPVEIAFTVEGEPLVTVDILHNQPSRNDAIIYAIEGGVYPWHDVYKEFPRTGELLPAVGDLGWVAPSGLMCYRSDAFGKEFQGNLFSAQFNRGRIQRHVVERHGASFKLKTEDFLVSEDKSFHPTDVMEDADGSLLVIDTGGWFRIGCPTSKIAQPEIKGAIYRIRKQGAPVVNDPRGVQIAWDKLSPTELTALLDDPRFMVRDRAIDQLALLGKGALPRLQKTFKSASTRQRRNAVWALTRMELPEARALVRQALPDRDGSVKLAAIHSVGLYRDEGALASLLEIVGKDEPSLKRQAATALGRIGKVEAVPALMKALDADNDRFLEHALIYALIRINQPESVHPYLKQPSAKVRRAALIALDQMPAGNLTREMITPFLTTDNAALLNTVLGIVAARPAWGSEIVGLLRTWLGEKNLEPARTESLRGLLISLGKERAIQDLVTDALNDQKTSVPSRLILLESITRSNLPKLPPPWIEQLGKGLAHGDARVVQQAVAGLRERGLKSFDDTLLKLAADSKRDPELRIAAFGAVAPRQDKVERALFQFVLGQLAPEKAPLIRLAAASALGKTGLNGEQLSSVTDAIATAGPLELGHLLGAFDRISKEDANPELGERLIAALEKTPSLTALSPAALEKTLAVFPAPVPLRGAKLLDRLHQANAQQRARLEELESLLDGGNLERGRDLFFGNKAACAACHALNGKGGTIGPELGKIGAIRSGRDLLESVIFPSASFARGFETFVIETRSGLVHTGIIKRETADAVYLVTAERNEIRIGRADIDNLAPGRVSIMPQGLDTQLSRQEIQDLMTYLQTLR